MNQLMKYLTGTRIMVICFSLGAVLIGRMVYVYTSHNSQTYMATSSSLSRSANPQLDQRRAKIANNLQNYFVKVRNELGKDDIGNLAMVVFLRQLAPKVVDQNPKLRGLCMTQKSCPVNLVDLYKVSLNRLDTAFDAPAKEVLQEQLIRSDLSREVKVSFLTQNMIGTRLQNIGPNSKMAGKTKVQFGPNAQYMLLTSRQLLQLQIAAPQYLQAMMNALSHSHDPVAKSIVMTGLKNLTPSTANTWRAKLDPWEFN